MKHAHSRGESWVMVFMVFTSPFSVMHEIIHVAVQVSDSGLVLLFSLHFTLSVTASVYADLIEFVKFG